jgi:hypothetical protein
MHCLVRVPLAGQRLHHGIEQDLRMLDDEVAENEVAELASAVEIANAGSGHFEITQVVQSLAVPLDGIRQASVLPGTVRHDGAAAFLDHADDLVGNAFGIGGEASAVEQEHPLVELFPDRCFVTYLFTDRTFRQSSSPCLVLFLDLASRVEAQPQGRGHVEFRKPLFVAILAANATVH